MEMDMQEPGEMCCCCDEEHDPAQNEIGLPATVCHIVISIRGINQSR